MSAAQTYGPLDGVTDAYDALEDALQGSQGTSESERVTGGGGDEHPTPARLQVVEHRHQLLRGLRYWCGAVRARGSVSIPADALMSVHAMAEWLDACTPLLPATDREEMAANLSAWLRTARALIERPRLRARLPVGACRNLAVLDDVEMWRCPGTMLAMIPADPHATAYLSCEDCRRRWAVTDLPEAADAVLTVAQAAMLAGVSVRTIQRRTGDREDGMVRLGDVLAPG